MSTPLTQRQFVLGSGNSMGKTHLIMQMIAKMDVGKIYVFSTDPDKCREIVHVDHEVVEEATLPQPK
jgi:GTP cyclohydrolase II